MLKKLIIPIIFLLSVQIVLAMYGGDTIKIFDESCINLTINVTVVPYQDRNEFKLSSCELLNYSNITSTYRCNCSEIFFTPAVNSVGNYTFLMEYFYQKEEGVGPSGGGDGGRGKRVTFKPFINISKPEKPIYTIFCGDGNCTKGEDCSNCARDCGECEIEISEPECIDGKLRCADGTLLICKNETWIIENICECIEGKCVKKLPIGLIIAIPLMILVIVLFFWWLIKKK